jgi:hypothetical protein
MIWFAFPLAGRARFSFRRAQCYKTRFDVDDEGEVCSLNWIHGETLPEADHFFMDQPPKRTE